MEAETQELPENVMQVCKLCSRAFPVGEGHKGRPSSLGTRTPTCLLSPFNGEAIFLPLLKN